MAKATKETSFLVSTAETGFFYSDRKNRKKARRGDDKLEIRKYDPIARKHVIFVEKKLSKIPRKFDRDKFIAKEES